MDHIPPRQFYATALRKKHKLNLLTIPVHSRCNTGYKHDEDYFVASLMPFVFGSYAGDPIYAEFFERYRKGQITSLMHKVIGEFDRNPSGLILPSNKVAKRFEGDRIKRIVWKIIRGLYYHQTGMILPQAIQVSVTLVPPGDPPPDHFAVLNERPMMGQYKGVFDYKFTVLSESNMDDLHYWGLLLWDRLIIIVMFALPSRPHSRTESSRVGFL